MLNSSSVLILFNYMQVGMAYLHGKRVIHRDLKPENCLVKYLPKLSIVIADFGLACVHRGEVLRADKPEQVKDTHAAVDGPAGPTAMRAQTWGPNADSDVEPNSVAMERLEREVDGPPSGVCWVQAALQSLPSKMGAVGTVDYMAPELCNGLQCASPPPSLLLPAYPAIALAPSSPPSAISIFIEPKTSRCAGCRVPGAGCPKN